MRVKLRFAARTLLLVALAGTAALTACGNAVETLLPEDNAGAGGTGGNSGSSGAIASAGSAGSSGGSGGVTPVTWQELSTTIKGTCAKAMCHNGMQQPTLLAVPAAAQYTALTTHPVNVCGAATRLVVPGKLAESAILKLVNGECMFNGAPFMMPGDCTQAPCLPAAQITTITNWIQSGAPGPS
jgi:hypothetical protein